MARVVLQEVLAVGRDVRSQGTEDAEEWEESDGQPDVTS